MNEFLPHLSSVAKLDFLASGQCCNWLWQAACGSMLVAGALAGVFALGYAFSMSFVLSAIAGGEK